MMHTRRLCPLLVFPFMLALFAGCADTAPAYAPFQPSEKNYSRPLPPGELALRKIPPERYPEFSAGFTDRAGLVTAINHSLDYLARPSSQRYYPYGEITHGQVVSSLQRFRGLLTQSPDAASFAAAIRQEFDVYESVGCDGRGTVFFTGYYTPIFEGRLERTDRFRYPLYGLPPDLMKTEEGEILGRRLPDGSIDPTYPTRRQLEQNRLLDGLEVAWLKDPFEAYIVTVQGSAKLRLADGSMYELGYAGNNGHPYIPISAAMVADGVIGRDEISLQRLRDYFADHPDQVYHYAWKNDRYVFFTPSDDGPHGSLNVPVTPYRTLATDKSVFPRAALTFISCDLPKAYGVRVHQVPYAAFALDQDTGGAIRAAGRGDVYLGVGRDAERLAGRTASEGRLLYLFLKPEFVRDTGP